MYKAQMLPYNVRCSCGRKLPKLAVHWIKTDITFDNRHYLTVTTRVKCEDCIGDEKRRQVAKIEPDPEGDKAVKYWVKKLGLREEVV